MDWKPLYDKMIVRRDPPPENIGNVVVPEEAKQPQATGEVVLVGEGRLNVREGAVYPLKVYPGCRVMFSPYSGTVAEDLGENMVILREDEILAWAEPVEGVEFTSTG